MAEPLVQAASRLVECCALVAIGYNLKKAGALRSSDGETALKLATSLTLPSVIVQALGNGPPLAASAASLLGVAVVCVGAQLAATWLYVMARQPRERSVLAGSATGLSLRLFGYPLAQCFFGGAAAAGGGGLAAAAGGGWPAAAALQSVAIVDFVNHAAVWLGSYLLFAGAGPAFPESFKHEDGGEYRGQWRGMRKEGLGVYRYASGARYEGEWRDNVKEGRGVYFFPKGGVYEGEWAGGVMSGLGVRTFASGQVKAGRWRGGQLEVPLELWQVALASDGAAAVAAAARSVEVGGGRLVDAAHMLAAQPTLWALLAGAAINLMRVPLPPWLDSLTGVLAPANAPLCLLAAGVTAPNFQPLVAAASSAAGPQLQLMADVARLLGSRLLVPLAVGLALTAMAAAGGGGAAAAAIDVGAGGRTPAAALLPLAAAMMALLAPVPPQALVNARRFRLNEATAATITAASYVACLPLMLLAGVAACAAGLAAAPPPPPPAQAAAAAAAAATGALVDARPLLAFAMAAVAAVGAAVGHVTQRADGGGGGGDGSLAAAADRRVLMVYTGPVEGVGQSPQTSVDGQGASASASVDIPSNGGGSGGSPTTSGEGSAGGGGGGRQEPGGPPRAVRDGPQSSSSAGVAPPPPPSARCGGGGGGHRSAASSATWLVGRWLYGLYGGASTCVRRTYGAAAARGQGRGRASSCAAAAAGAAAAAATAANPSGPPVPQLSFRTPPTCPMVVAAASAGLSRRRSCGASPAAGAVGPAQPSTVPPATAPGIRILPEGRSGSRGRHCQRSEARPAAAAAVTAATDAVNVTAAAAVAATAAAASAAAAAPRACLARLSLRGEGLRGHPCSQARLAAATATATAATATAAAAAPRACLPQTLSPASLAAPSSRVRTAPVIGSRAGTAVPRVAAAVAAAAGAAAGRAAARAPLR